MPEFVSPLLWPRKFAGFKYNPVDLAPYLAFYHRTDSHLALYPHPKIFL